jgi:glutathione S-transferase
VASPEPRNGARYGRFRGHDAKEQFEILRWLFWDNHKLTSYLATYRYSRAFTPSPDPHVQKHFRKRIDDFLAILERHLQDRSFVVAERATVADISMVGYLSFPKEEAGYDLAATHPAVHAWLGRVAKLPNWRSPYDLLPGKRLKLHV